MKKLLAILLALLMLTPYCVFAETSGETDAVISEEDYAAVELMWQTLEAAEERVLRSAANATTAQAVAAAVEDNDLYVEGTLTWNGEDNFTFETTVGVTCGYSARLRNLAMQAVADEEAMAEPNTQVISYAKKNAPSSKDVYVIEPYYGIDSSFTTQYQKEGKAIAEATGGTYTLYKTTDATIDAVADAIESGAVVIFDSHGDTDYAKGEDYTSGATTSYLLLQTGSGLTTTDYANDNGTYHAVNYGSYGSGAKKMYYYAVDGTCIANHMDVKAQNSFIWMAICLGMATDGLEKPLHDNGVEVVYGYSQSVTFDYDYEWEEVFWDEMIAGKTVASAIDTMKTKVGKWDCCNEKGYTTITQARKNYAAFPIVVSSEDTYPGHGNVDDLQTVYSTWKLYADEAPCIHENTDTVTQAPTCTEDGYVRTVCKDCGEQLSEVTVNKLGHNYECTTVKPTCTEKGYDLYTCSRCGDSYKENYTDALGHNYEAVVTPPTCTHDGYTTYTCSVCGAAYALLGEEKLGHDYVVTTVEPTCTEKGYDLYTCSRCGDSYKKNYTEALGHNYEAVVTPPTCTHDGYTTYTCSVCGEAYALLGEEKLGHNYVDGSCTRCGEDDPDYKPVDPVDPVDPVENPFTDVYENDWYYEYVMAAAEAKLVNGYNDSTFRPANSLTRAEAATLLYRLSGSPEVTVTASFTDLPNEWYREAIAWAESTGVVTGFPDGTFRPDETVTREQFVTMLWRLNGKPEATSELQGFEDTASVSEYAKTAFAWAVENGIVNGTTSHEKEGTYLAPQDKIKRCEVAKILCVFCDLI